MQKLMSLMRSAIEQYQMISDGDHIAVGLSGGKDSAAMLAGLAEMRRFLGRDYRVSAITLDPCFNRQETDYSRLEELCRRLNVPYFIKRTNLWEIIFEDRKESNPCSLCARIRRGALHDTAKELGCNKISLGHHQDDAAETFMMNLLGGGRASCFAPVSYLSRKDLYMIRPLIFADEKDILRAVRSLSLPVVKSACPADGNTHRQRMKELLQNLDKDYPGVVGKITGALQRGHIDRW